MGGRGDRDHDDYDVVVVGARCAGAATAMLLARGGCEVLLSLEGAPQGGPSRQRRAGDARRRARPGVARRCAASPLARALDGVTVKPVAAPLGRAAGVLLGATGLSNVIDAALVLLSSDGDDIVTDDRDDFEPLVAASGRHVELIRP